MSRLRVGVVGVGHLGKEHARILATLPDVELVRRLHQQLSASAATPERQAA